MKCEPSEMGVRLIPESKLEDTAVRRWAGMMVSAAGREGCWDTRLAAGPALRLEFRDKPPSEPEAPPSPRRTIRVPAIGQSVRKGDGQAGVVRYMVPHNSGVLLGMQTDVFSIFAAHQWDAAEVTPVGDDPKWIEMILPEPERKESGPCT